MKIVKLLLPITGLFATTLAMASGDHMGGHDHMQAMQPSMQEHHEGMHRHDTWVTPPAAYAGKTWNAWDDPAIAARGEQLFKQNCSTCHGMTGQGNGPAAAGLAHKPADLTNHFHNAPGDGDGYLFWRISEGGQVPPFKGMQSAMPPFKSLSEADRWAILTYVHQRFHGGFKMAQQHAARNEHAHSETGHTH